jgi:hypothetical protein
MNSIVNRMAILLVIGALTSVMAVGTTTEKKVTFLRSLTVNGTLVKKGTYKVIFNDETGELTIKKGGKVMASAQARLEKTNTPNSAYTHVASDDPAKPPSLLSVSLRDGSQATILNGTGNKTMSERQ